MRCRSRKHCSTAGLTAAEVEAAKAAYESSAATYRQTVLTAFQQVEDQLAAILVYDRELKVEIETVKIAKEAVTIALNEYRAGTQNFTTVVTAEATNSSTRRRCCSDKAARLTADVSLIVALGGGWDESELPKSPPTHRRTPRRRRREGGDAQGVLPHSAYFLKFSVSGSPTP